MRERLNLAPLSPDVPPDYLVESDVSLLEKTVEALRRPDQPLRSFVVLIPVAVAQDSALIYPALEQYARSEDCQPFSIALNLNQPAHIGGGYTAIAQAEVDRAVNDFPHLDVRTLHIHYDTPTIGKIRSDLWDAAVQLAQEESGQETGLSSYVGYNHDIDLMRLPRHFMQRSQQAYRQTEHSGVVGTPVRHYRSGEFPLVDRATAAYDFIKTVVSRTPFEAGLKIPFDTYRETGGFLRSAAIQESSVFAGDEAPSVLASLPLYTSPRRLIERAFMRALMPIPYGLLKHLGRTILVAIRLNFAISPPKRFGYFALLSKITNGKNARAQNI